MMWKPTSRFPKINLLILLGSFFMLTGMASNVNLFYTTNIPPDGTGSLRSVAVWIAPNPNESILFSSDKSRDTIEMHDPVNNVFLGRFGSTGTDDGELNHPLGLAVAYEVTTTGGIRDVLFVVEKNNGRVSMFSLPDTSFLGHFGTNEIDEPRGIALRWNGSQLQAWITEISGVTDKVFIYNISAGGSGLQGTFNFVFDTPALLEYLVIDSTNQRAYICDEDSSEVMVYSLTGTPIQTFGKGFFTDDPKGIVLFDNGNGNGFIIVTDEDASPVEFEIFDRKTYTHLGSFSGTTLFSQGSFLLQAPLPNLPNGAFFAPHDNERVHAYDWTDITNAVALNLPPVITPITNQSVNEGQTLKVGLSATDPELDAVTFTVSNLPLFATFTGVDTIIFTPGFFDASVYNNIQVIASDNGIPSGSDTVLFSLTVNDIPFPPAAPTALTATADGNDKINLNWTDPANNEIGFVIECKSGNGSFTVIDSTGTNITSFIDSLLAANTQYTYRVRAFNIDGPSAYSNSDSATTGSASAADPTQNIALNKPTSASSAHSNNPPSLASDGDIGTHWRSLILSGDPMPILQIDLQSQQIIGRAILNWQGSFHATSYELQASPNGVTDWTTIFSTITGSGGDEEFIFPGTPARFVRLKSTVSNTDKIKLSEIQLFSGAAGVVLTVISNQTMNEGDSLDVAINATDFSGGTLTLSTSEAPLFTTLTDSGNGNGTLRFKPDFADAGPHTVTVIATNDAVPPKADTTSFTLTVTDFNTPPQITPIANQNVDEGDTLNIPLSTTDAQGDSVSFVVNNLPSFGSHNAGIITFTPGAVDSGAYNNIQVIAVETSGSSAPATLPDEILNGSSPLSDTLSFNLTVNQASNTPAPPSGLIATANSSAKITVTWTDNSNDEDGFSIERKLNGGSYSVLGTTSANVTTYCDSLLKAATQYHYRARAFNSEGSSGASLKDTSITHQANEADPSQNLALNKPASASGSHSNNPPSLGVDGSTGSHWRSLGLNGDPVEWFAVDLQTLQFVGRVVIRWRNNYFATGHNLQISCNNVDWTTVDSTSSSSGGDEEIIFPQVIARFVRLNMLNNNSGFNNYKIDELEIYSDEVAGVSITGIPAQNMNEGDTLAVGVTTVNLGAGNVILSTSTILSFIQFTDNGNGTGSFAMTPSFSDSGTYLIQVFAETDVVPPAVDTTSFTLIVNDVNPAPNAPSNLTVIATDDETIVLNWDDNASNEDSVQIDRKLVGGSFNPLASVGANITTYIDGSLNPNTTYRYRVRAINTHGNSSYSNKVSRTTGSAGAFDPGINLALGKSATATHSHATHPPDDAIDGNTSHWRSLNVTGDPNVCLIANIATPEIVGRVVIEWRGDFFAANYHILLSTNNVDWDTVVTATGVAGSQEHLFTPQRARYIKLLMVASNSDKYKINEFEIYSGENSSPPAAPTSLTATGTGTSTIDLAWNDNSANEGGFIIERRSGLNSFNTIDTVGANSTSFNDTGLSTATTYIYQIFAYNGNGNSSYTDPDTATTIASGASDPGFNLALNKPAWASSGGTIRLPRHAVDGDHETYWRSLTISGDPNVSFVIDLQTPQTVGRAIIRWHGTAYATSYILEISNDNTTWFTFHTEDAGTGGTDEFTFTANIVRYIRLSVTANNSTSYKIDEFELYSGTLAKGKASIALNDLPTVYSLKQNYPNPFNPSTQISFDLPETGQVKLQIYDMLGKSVATLVQGELQAGPYSMTWNGRNNAGQLVAAGTYIYRLTAQRANGEGDVVFTKKMAFVK